MLQGHGGDLRQAARLAGVREEDILDFSSNVNRPLPARVLRACARRAADHAHLYPDPSYKTLREALAGKYGLPPAELLPGNGSTELLYLFFRAMRFAKVLVVSPGYADYADAARLSGAGVDRFYARERDGFLPDADRLTSVAKDYDAVVLGNPNNPTGQLMPPDVLRAVMRKNRKTFFLIDEAFIDYEPEASLLPDIPPNAAVSRSLTKFYGLAGVRLGFIAARPKVITRLEKQKEPWTINGFAQEAGLAICDGAVDEHKAAAANRRAREKLARDLAGIKGLKEFPSRANFLLLKTGPARPDAATLKTRLIKEHRILIRDCANFPGLSKQFFRVAVKGTDDNARLLKALRDALT